MPSDLLLPIFPLEVVLLPQTVLPLHIFEERYKLMLGEAIQHHSEFGIVLSHESSLLNIGCSASVEKVVRRYPDGRLDILAMGRRRFEILFVDEKKPYLQAGVVFFDDDPDTAPAQAALQEMVRLFERTSGFLPAQATEPPPLDKNVTSFQIAGALPLDPEMKQNLLGSRSEADRVTTLIGHLQKLLPRLKLAQKVERSSRGNGQGR